MEYLMDAYGAHNPKTGGITDVIRCGTGGNRYARQELCWLHHICLSYPYAYFFVTDVALCIAMFGTLLFKLFPCILCFSHGRGYNMT